MQTQVQSDYATLTQVLDTGGLHQPAPRSIYESSYLEALKHKWIASEQAGTDLGEGAISQWLQHHWRGWCRERWIEHLMGNVCWVEFDKADFGALRRDYQGDQELLTLVLDRVRRSGENLDIILWASESKLDVRQVIDILVIADINRPILNRARPMEERLL
jgi:hypothetical protein